MNQDESIAEQYLKKHYENVIYEPDGNIPPDFSVNDCVGIEVRRLNQQHCENGKTRGLEETQIPLYKAVDKEISQYLRSEHGNNFWLKLKYERDFGNFKEIKKNIAFAVNKFQAQNEKIPFTYQLSENVSLEFVAKANSLSRKYKIGVESDQDSGDWVVGMYTEHIMHCISEKEQKIQAYKNKYQSWWLLLVDHINCMDSYDKEDIVKKLIKPVCFEKVIVIKHDVTSQFEI